MHPMTLAFIVAAVSGLAVRLWLNLRQARHVAAHAGQVPEAFRDAVSAEEHRKAAEYTRARLRLGRYALTWSVALALIWTLGGGLEMLDGALRALTGDGFLTGVLFLVAVYHTERRSLD